MSEISDSERERIISIGNKWKGVKYVFGGKNRKGIDCSHFIHQVYCESGLKFRYIRTRLWREGKHPKFRKIEKNEAKLGDVIIFDSKTRKLSQCGHAGIFIDKNTFLGAQKLGVSLASYCDLMDDPNTEEYWGKNRLVFGYYTYKC